ncbi:hypothetical protein C0R01_31595 [Streptomyces albidoflavus]|uniref:Uncharacterized protein n=2 Tax=Streptomyces TaxID=1883 RepID=A0A385D5E2_9ACTN|nr:hypothetical protein D0C37_00225 [Streptomyces koyangensis]RZE37624.1 hypothetical protein C0Q91_18955 [Streptomyces albidoflavus]RZE48489.1 hypothetical protein C0Q97_30485 [Streptomyces albidoflavus]RZE60577.1 hypothetical protein C0R00_22680 [Streptomyces albidoflavus]RZE65948.1 hypothetical protein C0R01_31595 [Streptomyces albidoflavus]
MRPLRDPAAAGLDEDDEEQESPEFGARRARRIVVRSEGRAVAWTKLQGGNAVARSLRTGAGPFCGLRGGIDRAPPRHSGRIVPVWVIWGAARAVPGRRGRRTAGAVAAGRRTGRLPGGLVAGGGRLRPSGTRWPRQARFCCCR